MQRQHYQIIDITRACAILLMFIYHFCFDLSNGGIVSINFNHSSFWLNFRIIIVSAFLLLVGVSLAIANSRALNRKRFVIRLLLLALYSALVSVSSYAMFPKSWIFFGILHFILVASILGLLFVKLYWLNLLFGFSLIVIGNILSFSAFDQSYLQWVGLMTDKPITEDYVPLIPWFGVVLLGMFLGKLLFVKKSLSVSDKLMCWSSNHFVARLFAFFGRHAIHVYMLHQPIFIGLISAALWLMPKA
ncbi:hypothetical protein MNBD_GAMMA12-3011 [hydrothermal vent metagenome]|uniref:Heparan-alpha-glucosaminide N-acetyltransferase catalytic domain-containing protein n=1 Tax=hydrothermal vent metagenome TaxID=652676 RepID=A0A3B0XWT9_9ZZZZ